MKIKKGPSYVFFLVIILITLSKYLRFLVLRQIETSKLFVYSFIVSF